MRTFIRQPSDIPVEISSTKIPAGKHQSLKNISFGGLCCKTDKPIKTGTVVNVRLPSLGPDIKTRGRVSWCRRKNSDVEIGIQFLNKDSENRLHMVEQVCDIERYRKRTLKREGRTLNSEQARRELHKRLH